MKRRKKSKSAAKCDAVQSTVAAFESLRRRSDMSEPEMRRAFAAAHILLFGGTVTVEVRTP